MSLLSLPDDILSLCFSYINTKELITRVRLVNKHCKTASELKAAWSNSHLDVEDVRYLRFTPYLKSLWGDFNQPVNNLPASLIHLTFISWSKFYQAVDNLPAGLTHLILEGHFNQAVNNLPAGLTHLTLEGYFNQALNNLPAGLTHLRFGHDFN